MRKTCYTVYEKNPKGGLRYADEAIYDDGNIARPAGDRGLRGCPAGGRLVAFPTETVYGLGASAFNAAACARIFEVKRRPADKPLLCHLFSLEQAEEIAYLTDEARAFLRRYTPGPLTLVLKKKPCVPDVVSAGGDTVGLRFPANPVCRAFLRACGCPGGRAVGQSFVAPSPVTASPVIDAFTVRSTPCSTAEKRPSAPPRPSCRWRGAAETDPRRRAAGVGTEGAAGAMKIIGICGGSGSGKTEALRILAADGMPTLNCDAVSRQVMQPGSVCCRELCEAFGTELLREDGSLDRRRLFALTFNDPEKLQTRIGSPIFIFCGRSTRGSKRTARRRPSP